MSEEIRTYDGDKFELQVQSVQEYNAWRDAYINMIGNVLTVKFPQYYGKIEFNLKGGCFVNGNMVDGIKGTPIKKGELDEMVKAFDKLVKF